MKKYPLSYYQQAALQRLGEEGEIIQPCGTTLNSLVRRGLVTEEEIPGSENIRYRLNVIRTVGELIDQLKELDPSTPIAMTRGKGLVRPITKIVEDRLFVVPANRKIATTLTDMEDTGIASHEFQETGPVVVLK